MADFALELPFVSRFKNTRLFIKDGQAFFGIWRPLPVKMDGDEEQVIIQAGLEGSCDLLADAVYGDRRLWHVIAQANRIDFPWEQITVGTVLVIPKVANVRAALLASGVQVEGGE